MSVLGTFEGNILNLIDYCKDQLIPDFVNHVVVQVYHLEILQKMVSFTQYLIWHSYLINLIILPRSKTFDGKNVLNSRYFDIDQIK